MMNEIEQLKILEGILFLNGDDGIEITQINKILNISKKNTLDLIQKLTNKYDSNNHGLKIICFSESKYRITTLKEHYEYYQIFRTQVNKPRLSTASLEVLSIIAYNKLATKVMVENIRGICSDSIFNRLVRLNLIKQVGRSKELGRSFFYEVTDDFMKIFNIKSLKELPSIDILKVDKQQELFDN